MQFLSMIFVLFSLLSVPPASFAFTVKCPAEIHTSQQLTDRLGNWRPFQLATSHYLSQIELYDGKPEELAALKPDSQSDEKAVWHFRRDGTTYLACRYNNTSVQLTTALPKEISRCTVWYSQKARNQIGEGIPERLLCE